MAGAKPDTKTAAPLVCHYGCASECAKRCTRCWSVAYCSVACQTKHWAVHKTTCRPPQVASNATSSAAASTPAPAGPPPSTDVQKLRVVADNSVFVCALQFLSLTGRDIETVLSPAGILPIRRDDGTPFSGTESETRLVEAFAVNTAVCYARYMNWPMPFVLLFVAPRPTALNSDDRPCYVSLEQPETGKCLGCETTHPASELRICRSCRSELLCLPCHRSRTKGRAECAARTRLLSGLQTTKAPYFLCGACMSPAELTCKKSPCPMRYCSAQCIKADCEYHDGEECKRMREEQAVPTTAIDRMEDLPSSSTMDPAKYLSVFCGLTAPSIASARAEAKKTPAATAKPISVVNGSAGGPAIASVAVSK